MDFPVLGVDSVRLIVYTTVIGLISASFGVYLQKYVSGWLKGAVEKDEL
jgi:putative membrane protein